MTLTWPSFALQYFCRPLSQNIDKASFFLPFFFCAHSYLDMLLALEKQLLGMHINLVITF